jgi:hypothetical protein
MRDERLVKAIAAQLQNAFCATGQGGGVDPSCGKDGDVAAQKEGFKDAKDKARFEEASARYEKKHSRSRFEEASRRTDERVKRDVDRASKLPKDPAKLTIRQAAAGLQKLGYKLGTKGGAYYVVKGGKSQKVTTAQIKDALYPRPKAEAPSKRG